MRALRVAAATAAMLLVAAPVAPTHEGNPNFRSEIDRVEPVAEGLEVEVLGFDDSLRLVNRTGEDVVVEGYEGEPYARLRADGTVELNRNSTAYYLNRDRFGRSQVPESLDPRAPPDWERLDGSGALSFHDHRIHWMAETVPPQVGDESVRTEILDYEIPITVGGRRGEIAGTLYWVGQDSGFPLLPFVGLGGLALAAAALVLLRRRSRGGPW